MTIKVTNNNPYNVPTFSDPSPSKICPNLDYWYLANLEENETESKFFSL
jgi:hypothetical protein